MPFRVLVIEDDFLMGTAISDTLGFEGCEVILARNKEEARNAFSRNPAFAAIMLDGWVDDVADTCDLIREFRSAGFTGPMIAMSNKLVTRANQMAAGCSHEVAKREAARFVADLLNGF